MPFSHSRRTFVTASLLTGLAPQARPASSLQNGSLTDVPGLKVGHFTDPRRPTGCTAILAESGAVAGVDVRGGAPGTRETDLLNPVNTVQKVHAVVLSGGSAFGLAAASGVMDYLAARGIGFAVGAVHVPIVPAAILFDLGIGDPRIRPTAESGYEAAKAASGLPVLQGNVGAGAGATVGKWLVPGKAMKGGLGSAAMRLPNGFTVGALVAVNAIGDIIDPDTNRILAGMRTPDGAAFADTMARFRAGLSPSSRPSGTNSTIGVVASDADLSKAEVTKVAQMAHDAFARAIRPAHLPFDGDTIFALATGKRKATSLDVAALGVASAEVMVQAILSAIVQAKSIPDYPAYSGFAGAGLHRSAPDKITPK